jgi:hypothetical protein
MTVLHIAKQRRYQDLNMALDTASKRASVASVARPWRPTALFPDGTISVGDRAHIGWNYSGLTFDPPQGGVLRFTRVKSLFGNEVLIS